MQRVAFQSMRVTSQLKLASHSLSLSQTRTYNTSPSNFDSHSDFEPKLKHPVGQSPETQDMIKSHVTENPVMLYMKGSPNSPQCGFSAKTVQILKELKVDFSSVNVLQYDEIREGIKTYAGWPTIPQLYVGGEFVGGCDIITEMYEDGSLKEELKEYVSEKERA